MVNIKKINSKKDLNDFICFPWQIYKDYPLWVPPLISEQKKFFNPACNSFFKSSEAELFIARDSSNKILGRIAAVKHQEHLDFNHDDAGFFGFFECVDNQDVADALFDRVAQWLNERELKIMRGPMNFTINDSCGLLIQGFEHEPALDMPYNPPYYEKLISKYGLCKKHDLFAFHFKPEYVADEFRKRVFETASRVENRGGALKPMNISNPVEDAKILQKVYEEAWEGNWGHVPMSEEAFLNVAMENKKLFNPQMCLILKYKGEPAGAFFAFPDYAPAIRSMNGRVFPFGFFNFLIKKKKIKKFRVILLGIFKKFRNLGLESMVLKQMDLEYPKSGFNEGEFSWILESNHKVISTIENIGARKYKTYRIYDKEIV